MTENNRVIIPKDKKDKVLNDLNEPVGLRLERDSQGEHFKFYFPPQYTEKVIKEDGSESQSLFDYKDDIIKLLRIIDKFRDNDSFDGNGKENFLPIYSCLWVINDYITNGVYKETEKYYTCDISGKISWKNTIKKVMPFVNEGQLVYPKFNVERLRQIDNELFVKIQMYCVNLSTNIVGWYFGIKPQEFVEYNKEDEQLKYFIKYLTQKKQETFLDYKKMLIDCMLSILKEVHQSGSIFSSVFTDSFHTVFENLVVNAFSTVSKDDLKHFYPTSKWYLYGDKEGKEDSKLRPDAIYINNDSKKIFIIDAKYYNYGYQGKIDNISDLPSTSDVSKQVRYAEDLETKLRPGNKILDDSIIKKYGIGNDYKIYNIFILPFSDPNQKVKYIGYNEMKNNVNDNKPYTKVYTYMVDLKTLTDAFFNDSDKKKLNVFLIKEIKGMFSTKTQK